MAKQILNVGTNNNDKTGDTLRAGGLKIKANFDEIYAALASNGINISGGNVLKTGDYQDLSNKPVFATVATSGDFYDLTDRPDLGIFVGAPANDMGSDGHVAGNMAFDNNFLYVCKDDYVQQDQFTGFAGVTDTAGTVVYTLVAASASTGTTVTLIKNLSLHIPQVGWEISNGTITRGITAVNSSGDNIILTLDGAFPASTSVAYSIIYTVTAGQYVLRVNWNVTTYQDLMDQYVVDEKPAKLFISADGYGRVVNDLILNSTTQKLYIVYTAGSAIGAFTGLTFRFNQPSIWESIPWTTVFGEGASGGGSTGDWTWPTAGGGTQALLGGTQNSWIDGQSPGGLLLHNDYTITLQAGDMALSLDDTGSIGLPDGSTLGNPEGGTTCGFVSADEKDFLIQTSLAGNTHTWDFQSDGTLEVPGNIVPNSDITQDLGTATKRFRDLYLSGTTIKLGESTISTGASGAVTFSDGLTTTTVETGITSIKSSGWGNSGSGSLPATITLEKIILGTSYTNEYIDDTWDITVAYGWQNTSPPGPGGYVILPRSAFTTTAGVITIVDGGGIPDGASGLWSASAEKTFGIEDQIFIPIELRPSTPAGSGSFRAGVVGEPVDPTQRAIFAYTFDSNNIESLTLLDRGENYNITDLEGVAIKFYDIEDATSFTTLEIANAMVESYSTGGFGGVAVKGSSTSFADLTVTGDLTVVGDVHVSADSLYLGTLKLSAPVSTTLKVDGDLELLEGSTITETATTLVLTPPTALAGQGLVIRTTVGGGLSTTDTFTPGGSVTVTFTDNGSHLSSGGYVDDSESNTWAYTITGISEADLGSPLTGSFLAENWGIPGIGQNVITFNIPAESTGTGFTITLDKIITDPPYYLQDIFGINEDGRIYLTVGEVITTEVSHVHLTTADPTTVDLYLGDDNQYVKIEKDGGDVVIGTNTNTHRWRFDTNGALTFPDATTQTTGIAQGQYLLLLDGTNTMTYITNVNFNLLLATPAIGYMENDTHVVQIANGAPGQRFVIVNNSTQCIVEISPHTIPPMGRAEFVFTSGTYGDGWVPLYGTLD